MVIGPFRSSHARVLAVLGGRSPSPSFWHVSCVAVRTSTLQHCLHQKTRPNETSVLASAPTCHDPTSFSNTASSNKGLGNKQNFGQKSERGRSIMNQPKNLTRTVWSLLLLLLLLLLILILTLRRSFFSFGRGMKGPREGSRQRQHSTAVRITVTIYPTMTKN